jgi:tetratricopeptide (TPR) repeat protein
MPEEHDALVLEILKEGHHLKMSLFEHKDLVLTLRQYSEASLNAPEIERLCAQIIFLLNRADRRGLLDHPSLADLKRTGSLLWDNLISRAVKEKLRRAAASDLILSLDEELISIPWELLYTGEEFLCLKFNIGRVVRTKEQTLLPQYRSVPSVARMLVLANPTDDLKSAYTEGLFIRNQFDRRRKEVSIDFKSTHIDTLYVKKNLREYDIVHFAGHCEFDSHDPKNSGWVLSDGKFSGQDIAALAETSPFPSLVFSNACHSAQVGSEYLHSECQKLTYGLASAFLFSGVRHYIGAIRRIEDASSLVFAQEFYTQLMSGKSLGECVRLARLKLARQYGPECIFWASYLLYGDPHFRLFHARAKSAPRKIKKIPKRLLSLAALGIAGITLAAYLYMWLPSINPSVYFLSYQAHNSFLKGRNNEVLKAGAQLIKKEPDFLKIYPLLADTYQRLGDKENTLKYYFIYASLAQKKHDKNSLAAAYDGLGWAYHLQGDYDKAFDFYQKALALSLESGNRLGQSRTLERLAVWYTDKGQLDKALELLMRSSSINLEKQNFSEHRYGLACDYFDLGRLYAEKGDLDTAKEFYQKSRRLFEKLKMKHELSDYYFNLGEISLMEKQYQQALDYYLRGLSIDLQQAHKPNIASDYNMLGELYLEMDNLAQAQDYFEQASALARQINALPELANAYYDLGILYKKKGRKNKARENLRLAQEIYCRMDTPEYQQIKEEFLELDSP